MLAYDQYKQRLNAAPPSDQEPQPQGPSPQRRQQQHGERSSSGGAAAAPDPRREVSRRYRNRVPGL